jgi:hypothetical protein
MVSNRARLRSFRPCCSQSKCRGSSNIMNSTPMLATSRRKRKTIHEQYAINGQGILILSIGAMDVLFNHVWFPVSEPIDCLARRATMATLLDPCRSFHRSSWPSLWQASKVPEELGAKVVFKRPTQPYWDSLISNQLLVVNNTMAVVRHHSSP